MPKDYSRTQRVADYLRRELAQVIQLELRDPRIGMLSITDVEISRDMAYAKVYYTSMAAESADEAKESTEVLNKAAGFLRGQIAKNSTLRITPRLRFYYDSSVGRGRQLSDLIEKAAEADRKIGLRLDDEDSED
jgi:ribosome-binding factor A